MFGEILTNFGAFKVTIALFIYVLQKICSISGRGISDLNTSTLPSTFSVTDAAPAFPLMSTARLASVTSPVALSVINRLPSFEQITPYSPISQGSDVSVYG